MECACISANVDDFCQLLFEKHVISRKEHKCNECKKTIAIGEKYHFEKTVYEGEFDEYHTCLDCYSARKYLICDFYYGGIWPLIKETFEEYIYDDIDLPWAKIARLTKIAREKICDIIEECWADLEE